MLASGSGFVVRGQDGWQWAQPDLSRSSTVNGTPPVSGAMLSAAMLASPVTMAAVPADSGVPDADKITPELQAIADALGRDPLRIYEWVGNTIHFTPYYGVKRGAHLTAIERTGNDFDTSALLVALLRAAGVSGVRYRIGWVSMPMQMPDGRGLENWLGVDRSQVVFLLRQTGCTYNGAQSYHHSGPDSARVLRVWVTATIGGTERDLDPSFKRYTDATPVDIRSAVPAYSRSALLTSAGGTLETVSGASANSKYTMGKTGPANLGAALAAYTGAFVEKARRDWHEKSGMEIAGVRTICQEVIEDFPDTAHLDEKENATSYDKIPSGYGVEFTLKVADLSYTCYTAQLQGRKLAIWFSGNRAQFWLDDQKVAEEASASSASAIVSFKYEYPFNSSQTHSVNTQAGLARTGAYVVAWGFGHSLGRLQERLRLHADYVSAGKDPAARELRTENLNIVALQYLNQLATLSDLAGAATGCYIASLHFAGIAGQLKSPYVDLPLNLIASRPKAAQATDWYNAKWDLHTSNSTQVGRQLFAGIMYVTSALEHVTINQTIPDRGVSTVRMLEIAAGKGHPVFLARNITDLNAIKSQLSGYTANINTGMVEDALASQNGHILLPKNLNMEVGKYKGNGYMLSRLTDSGQRLTMGISGGLSGGFATTTNNLSSTSFFSNTISNPVSITGSFSQYNYGADPVDLSNGAFHDSWTDIALPGDGVHGLALTRTYTTARRTSDPVGLGKGWTHNYDLRLTLRHSSDIDLQRASAADVAPFIIGFRAIHDILRGSDSASQTYRNWRDGDARDWTLPAIIACWMGDQLVDSRASISLGDRAIEFTRLPDGTYAPPPGVAATLVKNSNNTHTLQFRKGLEITFRKVDTGKNSGRFTSITDRNNSTSTARTLTATWNDHGNPSKITDAFGRTLTFTYSGGTVLTKVTDSTKRSVSYARSGSGDDNTLAITDPEGSVSRYTTDSKGRITRLVDARGSEVVRSTYDSRDRVTWQQALGNPASIWRLGYAPGLTRHIDPSGNDTWYYFDPRDRRVARTDELGNTTRQTYDGSDRLVSTTTPLGRASLSAWDRNHELVWEQNPAGNERYIVPDVPAAEGTATPREDNNFGGQATVTHYYTWNKPSKIVHPGGITSEYQYETRGRVAKARPASFAAGQWITYAYTDKSDKSTRVVATWPDATTDVSDYNARGELVHQLDRLGHRTTIAYNNRSQPTKIVRWPDVYTASASIPATPPAGSLVNTITYDAAGDILTEATGDGTDSDRVIRYEHNALGKLTGLWTPDGNRQIENIYDARHLPLRTHDVFNFETGQEYDAAQRPVLAYDPLVRGATQTYDADGRPVAASTPRGRPSTLTYNAAGFVATATDGFGRAITYGYDRDGRATSLKNRLGRTWTTTYDDANRRVTTKTPLGHTTVAQSNVRGLTERVTAPSGAKMENTAFDNEGRVTQQVYRTASGTVEATVTLAYYADGALKTVAEQTSAGTRTTTRTYDNFGRLATYTDGEGNTLGYTYDKYGNLATLVYPGSVNKTVSYTYDINNRLKTVKDWDNRTTTYYYDEAGRAIKLTRPNGTWRHIVYDAAGQVRQIEERKSGETGQLLWLRGLAYTDNGRTGDLRKNDGEITWTYDYPSPPSFTLPADTATYNNDNQIATFTPAGGSAQTVTHDANGNMTNGPAAAPALSGAPSLAAYTYDARDRLTAHGGTTYRYNPDGLRVQATTGSTTETYVVDPSGLSRVLMRTKGGTTTYYIWGAGLLYEVSGSTTKTYHPDHLGSTVAITDSSGNATDRITYAPYGSITDRTGTTDTPFLFHGSLGILTDLNGLTYMRARYYHPRLQRFINKDPIGFNGGLNWYALVSNNPMTGVDPQGTQRVEAAYNNYLNGPVTPLINSARDPVTATNIIAGVLGGQGIILAAPAAIASYSGLVTYLAGAGGGTAVATTAAKYQYYTNTGIRYSGIFSPEQGFAVTGQLAAQAAPHITNAQNYILANPQIIAVASDFADGFFAPPPAPPTPAGQVGGAAAQANTWFGKPISSQ
jgi:RHS repeat-associated protein